MSTVFDLVRKQSHARGHDECADVVRRAIDEAIRVVAEHRGPETRVRLSAMLHVRTIVLAQMQRKARAR